MTVGTRVLLRGLAWGALFNFAFPLNLVLFLVCACADGPRRQTG
jgi:hypothetical protein